MLPKLSNSGVYSSVCRSRYQEIDVQKNCVINTFMGLYGKNLRQVLRLFEYEACLKLYNAMQRLHAQNLCS